MAYDALFRLPSDERSASGARALRSIASAGRSDSRRCAVISTARARQLAKAQSELEALAHKTENWQMAAPGAQPTAENSPVSYKLRQDIRQYREDVGRAERRLRELEVEASLAGVPAEWRQPGARRRGAGTSAI